MMLSIHQPSYFPWLGLLNKISKSDVHMILDEVQLSDSAYQHRNVFLTADGQNKFLTIPVRKGYLKLRFCEIEIASEDWRDKHLAFIENTYRKHPYFEEVFEHLEPFFAKKYRLLLDAVVASMRVSFELFAIRTEVIFQSDMTYDKSLRRTDLVVGLVRAAGAECYLSGEGAKSYMDESAFGPDIRLCYNTFQHPAYTQKTTDSFRPGLSCLDSLFNIGIDAARLIIQAR